jgi:glycine cleavage system H protein
MNRPDNLLYTKTHEWLKIDGQTATVGITDFAQKELTDIVFVELPKTGRKVNQGDACAVVESVKTAADIFSPVAGEIIEVNRKLEEKPELINEDPFGAAWLFKVKLSGMASSADLMSSKDYTKTVEGGAGH